MQLDSFPFNQHRFKRLNTQAVQGRSTVEQHRVVLGYFFQNIPNFRADSFQHFLGGFQRYAFFLHQFANDKRFKQFQRHQFGQTALVQFQVRADHNNGTAGIVHAFPQQVLAEAAVFAFDAVRQGFKRSAAGPNEKFAAGAVFNQGVHRFLQEAFFVVNHHFRRAQGFNMFQAVVAVDDSAVQIVEVGRRKPAAVERNERTQIRRDDGQYA